MKNPLFMNDHILRDKRTKLPLKIRGEFDLPTPDGGEDPIITFLFSNAEDLGIKMQPKDLKKTRDLKTPTGRVVSFEQLKDNIRIIGTEINVRLDQASRIKQIDLTHIHDIAILQPVKDEKPKPASDSVKTATNSIGKHTLRQNIANPEKVYFPTPKGLKLAYEVLILTWRRR